MRGVANSLGADIAPYCRNKLIKFIFQSKRRDP